MPPGPACEQWLQIKVESGPTDSRDQCRHALQWKGAAGRKVQLRVTNGLNRGDAHRHLNRDRVVRHSAQHLRHWSRCY